MGQALVTDVGFCLDPSTTVFTAASAGAGSTLSVRNFPFSSTAHLLDMWANGATKGALRLRSPKFGDNVQGIRVNYGTALQLQLLDPEFQQFLIPQDQLIAEMLGGASETDTFAIQSYYDDLTGASPTLKMPGDIMGSLEWVNTWVVNTTAGAVIGNYGSTPITNLYDVSQANRWYAVLGYVSDVELTAIGITGADQSFLNVAGPGSAVPRRTRNYFSELSLKSGKPCIPLFNTANKGNTNVITADKAASTTANVSLIVAIMPASWTP